MRENWLFAFLTTSIFLVFPMIPSIFICPWIFNKIGISKEISEITSRVLLKSIPIFFTQMYGEIIKSYCYSQGIESIFGIVSIASFFLTLPITYFFVISQNYGIDGFIYSRTIEQTTIFVIYLIVFFTKTKKESRGFEVSDTFLTDFLKYFKETMILTFADYS